MAGLLGEDDKPDLGLLGMLVGSQILAANQPGVGFGQALGAGMGAGLQGFQQMQGQAEQKRMRDLQMRKLKAELGQQDRWNAMFGGGAPGLPQTMPAAGPQMAQAGASPAGPVSASPMGNIPPAAMPFIGALGPQAGGKLIAEHMLKPRDQWEDIGGGLQRNATTGETKPISNKMVDVSVNPNINMPPVQTKEQETVGKFYGETYTQLQSDAMKARGQSAQLTQLGTLLDSAYTGKGAETVLELKRAAKALGVDVGDVGSAEAAQAISRQIALELRNPAGGAGMPGAMSDADRQFLISMVPGLSQTPEGSKQLIAARKKVNDRSIEVAKMARDYRKKHGMIDEGFFDELQAFSEKNPLFKGQVVKAPAAEDPLGLR